jgi:hypothetical protein
MTDEEYYANYKSDLLKTKRKREKAFEVALKVRELEFNLYWTRLAYGWAFLGVIFAGYMTLHQNGEPHKQSALIVACLGFVFSVAWYCISRGSASWLRNWEIHTEILEDAVIGPLFKSVMGRETYQWHEFWLPYPYSPQRINNILALACVATWLYLLIKSLKQVDLADCELALLLAAIAVVVGLILVAFVKHPDDYPVQIKRHRRIIKGEPVSKRR